MIVAIALMALVLVPQGFSKAKGYVKATLGGGYTSAYGDVIAVSAGSTGTYEAVKAPIFAIKPAGGVEWKSGTFAFALELSVGLGFGKDLACGSSLTVVDPGLMGIFSFNFGRLVPYVGVGVSVPMVFADGGTVVFYSNQDDDFAYSAFAIDALLGFGVSITKNIMPTLELEGRAGFSPYGTTDFQARLGCVVKFGR